MGSPGSAPGAWSGPANATDGRILQYAGFAIAVACLVVPLLFFVAALLGVALSTRRGKGGHGALVILTALILTIVGLTL
jgi:hypothetical protein